MTKTKELTKKKISNNGQVEDIDLQKELNSIVGQYNDAIEKKNQYDNLATRCIGAIEILKKLIGSNDAEIRKEK
tara:strand:- start:244 stop:465 length:222 start_codon:yes stop_codon:yes gene_type:complete